MFIVHAYNTLVFQLLLFALSTAVDGAMTTEDYRASHLINGTSQADMLCQKEAQQAGLWGTYSALLSTKHRPLHNITAEQYRHLPIVNTMVSGKINCKFHMSIIAECISSRL